jgi:hypothetical protein
MHFRLRTLLVMLAILPPLLAGVWWTWRERPSAAKPFSSMGVTPRIIVMPEEDANMVNRWP